MTISVVIPAYNAAHWLQAAVNSVLAQSLQPLEIVVVDDGSSDETPQLCPTFGSGVRYVRRENGGLSAARNTGVACTSGEWLLFLDADDVLVPGAIEALARTAESTLAGVVYGFVLQRWEHPSGTKLHGLSLAAGPQPVPAKAHFWWTAIPTAGAALIRRTMNEQVGGFDENFRQVEDAEYWLRCGVTAAFAHCDALVLDKSFSPGSLGKNTMGSIWYRLQLQRKFLQWCSLKQIDTTFLGVREADLSDHALKRIHFEKAWGILDQVLDQARSMEARTFWYWRSLLTATALRLVGNSPANRPAYPVVWSRWTKD